MLPVTFMRRRCVGCRPTRGRLFAPTAIVSGIAGPPFVGMIGDRSHPLCVLGFGFSVQRSQ